MMILTELRVQRKDWGDDAGKLVGKVTFSDDSSEVTFKLNTEQIDAIFRICAQAIENVAKESAVALVCNVIEQRTALGASKSIPT